MKKIFFTSVLVLMCIIINAQKFVRIYNASGKKIAKGYLVDEHQNDSFLVVKRNNSFDTIPVKNISYIKTKHSFGNNVLVGTIVGTSIFAIAGAISAGSPCDNCIIEFTAGEGAAAGAIAGAPLGAVIGAITGLLKNSKTILINGDIQQWLKNRVIIE